jgi:hypothetical protein
MIPHSHPTLRLEEPRDLSGVWASQGPAVEAFEDEPSRFLYLLSAHAVAVSSCSAAQALAHWQWVPRASGSLRQCIPVRLRATPLGLPVAMCALRESLLNA